MAHSETEEKSIHMLLPILLYLVPTYQVPWRMQSWTFAGFGFGKQRFATRKEATRQVMTQKLGSYYIIYTISYHGPQIKCLLFKDFCDIFGFVELWVWWNLWIFDVWVPSFGWLGGSHSTLMVWEIGGGGWVLRAFFSSSPSLFTTILFLGTLLSFEEDYCLGL